jgi:CheY-like chemotaxis protein
MPGPEKRLPRIFVAEDNPGDVYLVRMALQEHGVNSDLQLSEHGDQASRALREMAAQDPPDLVLMDLNLPGKGGIEILSELRSDERFQKVPVVVMTSSAAASDRAAAEELGISHYFRKPTHLNDFLVLGEIIKTLLPAPAGK